MSLRQTFGSTLADADPDHVISIAARFSQLSDAADRASGLLTSRSHLDWYGEAADLFENQVGSLPDELAKVRRSFAGVAAALNAYAGELSGCLAAARRIADTIDTCQLDLRQARTHLSGLQDAGQIAEWTGYIHSLESELATAQRAAAAVTAELEWAAQTCVTGLQDADGSVFNHGLLHRLEHDAGAVADSVVSDAKAALNWVEHQNWDAVAHDLRIAAQIVGGIALVAGIVAFGLATGGVGLVAVGALAEVGAAAGTVGTVLAVSTVGADVIALRTDGADDHRKDRVTKSNLAWDSIGAFLSVGGAFLGRSAEFVSQQGAKARTVLPGNYAERTAARVMQDVRDAGQEARNTSATMRDLSQRVIATRSPLPVITHLRTWSEIDAGLRGAVGGPGNPSFVRLHIGEKAFEAAGSGLDIKDDLQSAGGS